ncbi:leucyl/phenylalanyl-tRNA--protein transferase [Altererythrobacter sp. Root672]|uniref:leucyl/phenylalanyl-tRNA--protein transferase n=1 Tax=Altererythrobacter sp. Root672 TaxID=1736584 RepID=UPI0009EC262F|nr:leucyl/phenylalanyl-tRNA--protein transferase [Altererythrobacter sp. Root672]
MHAPATKIIPEDLLLMAYRSGIFPMADSRDDEDIYWVEPRDRAIIPLEEFRCSRSLAKVIRQDRFRVTCNHDFEGVIEACAAPREGHPESWISERIAASYRALHIAGHAHSIECWDGDRLVGGLYGVGFDHAFCGESMFSRATDASKVALAWLVALLRRGGYELLDCQFMTDHLASLGAVPVTRECYLERLTKAVMAGPAPSLPEVYASFAAGVSTGAGEGAVTVGSGAGSAPAVGVARGVGPLLSDTGLSSPGKLILQSLTQTS